ncbi:hypothetical protein [Cohnella sp.]|uniref:hypothetical protein n=1 Tax=Cohnella sp. TaxID=1883426 RepID=UPI0035675F22
MTEMTKKASRSDDSGERLSKSARLDLLIESQDRLGADDIIRFVDRIFSINLKEMPLLPGHNDRSLPAPAAPGTVLDAWLERVEGKASAADIRGMINQAFGINLEALSALEGKRIALFSKRQWMVRDDRDLFELRTGDGDADVTVRPTAYLLERIGSGELPALEPLIALGFGRNVSENCYFYASSDGKAVADAFKGRTMAAILNAIREHYAHL